MTTTSLRLVSLLYEHPAIPKTSLRQRGKPSRLIAGSRSKYPELGDGHARTLAALALVLATVAVYGVLAYAISQKIILNAPDTPASSMPAAFRNTPFDFAKFLSV